MKFLPKGGGGGRGRNLNQPIIKSSHAQEGGKDVETSNSSVHYLVRLFESTFQNNTNKQTTSLTKCHSSETFGRLNFSMYFK